MRLVSVLIPAFNAEKWIEAAVRTILNQSFSDLEVVIVDDGSTDATVDRIKHFHDSRIRLVRMNHVGFIPVLNRGIHMARGKWIARMDADDICHPHRLSAQFEALDRHPGALLCGTGFGYITPGGYILERRVNFDLREIKPSTITLGEKIFADATVVFRKDAAIDVGLYDEDIRHNELSLWYKLLKIGSGIEIGKNYYFQRLHPGGMNVGQIEAYRDARRVRRRYDPGSAGKRFDKKAEKSVQTLYSAGLKKKIILCQHAGDKWGSLAMALKGMPSQKPKAAARTLFVALKAFGAKLNKNVGKPYKIREYWPHTTNCIPVGDQFKQVDPEISIDRLPPKAISLGITLFCFSAGLGDSHM